MSISAHIRESEAPLMEFSLLSPNFACLTRFPNHENT
jgi:hypothetical protein